jgi:hypothetical protein
MKTDTPKNQKSQLDLTWALLMFIACIIYALLFQEEAPLNDLFFTLTAK